jgi:paraquat-inducible protein B
MKQVESIDFDHLIKSLTGTANAINGLVTSPKLQRAVDSLSLAATGLAKTSASVQRLADHLDQRIVPASNDLRLATQQARLTLKQAQDTLVSIQDTLSPNSPLEYQLMVALRETSDAAHSMKELADFIHRNPSSLLRGRYEGAAGR